MADVVRSMMEEMIPELDDLEELGIFSSAEIKQIVKQRRKFEYGLRRRAPVLDDFLHYIEYEFVSCKSIGAFCLLGILAKLQRDWNPNRRGACSSCAPSARSL